jgi:hypothetical protein
MAYDLGSSVPLSTDITDATGAATAAAGVVCTIAQPDGTTVTPTVANPTLGRYTVDFVPTQPGRHTERWVSTTPAAARTDVFDVRAAVPGYLMSLLDAKDHLNKSGQVTTDDGEILFWSEVATEVVEELARHRIAPRTVVETFDLRGYTRRLALTYSPVMSLTSITRASDGAVVRDVAGVGVDATSGIVTIHTGPAIGGAVVITYRAGYPVVPARYVGAAKMILRHLWSTQRANVGATRRGQIGGAPAADETILVAGWAVPRAAAELIGPRPPMVYAR